MAWNKSDISVLIVEDDEIQSFVIDYYLKNNDFNQVYRAVSGEKGIEVALDKQPQLILLDIKLSDDTDGIEVARRIKEVYQPVIIYITGNSDKPTRNRAAEVGFQKYLVKPVMVEEIMQHIEEVLDGKEAEG